MKILILGAAGGMSLTTIMDLLVTSKASKIILSDYNGEKVKQRSQFLNDNRVVPLQLDIRDIHKTAEVMKDVDIVINEASYEFNIDAMKAAMEAHVNLIDLGGLYKMTKKQLELHKEVEKTGILVIPGIGSDPGTSNILCRYGADKLDQVDEIHIRYGSSWSGLTFTFAVKTILQEATLNAVIFENGVYKEIPALSRSEDTIFREPVGIQRTYCILHSELASIPETIRGVKAVTYHDSWDQKFVNKIRALDSFMVFSEKKITIRGIEMTAYDFMVDLLSQITVDEEPTEGWDSLKVTVKGKKDREETTYIFEVLSKGIEKNGVTPLSYMTGVPPSIVAQMITNGEIMGKGVLPPEICIDPKRYIHELVNRSIDFFETKIQTSKYPKR